MSQASTIAASSQSDSLRLALTTTRADLPVAQLPALPQSPGALPQDFSTPVLASPFAQSCGPTYRGDPPTPAPAPVSGPSPAVHLAHSDPFARARIAAVQSRVAAPVLSDPRPPPPVPVFSPFRDGHYWCSKCPRRGFTTIPGLMRHVTHQHAGSSVDEATCSLFAAIERVTCTAPACGGLRRMGARICNRCGQASQARPPRVGDVVMGPLGAPASREDVVMADAEAPATPSLSVDLPLVALPAGFTQRIRALPSSTILHVPASCRLRMISVVAQCWNGMAQGRDDYAQLEEGRSKLLLSTVPQGLSVASEVQKRLTLWEERSFEALLQRAEEQLLLKRKAGKWRKSSGPSDPSERGDRARRTAAVGAYRKPPRGLSPPCSPSLNRRIRLGPGALPPPILARPLTVILTWLPLLLCQSPPGRGHSLACTMRLSPLLAQLGHAQSTLQTYSMSRAGFMPTRFTLRSPRCFVGSPLAPYLPLPGGSLGHGSAGNARKMASPIRSRWVSFFALPTPSVW